jgi:tetratricopeptide (TPR) repeat protein
MGFRSLPAVVAALLLPLPLPAAEPARAEIPITTTSPEAKTLYVQGQDLAEKLRITDAQVQFNRAVEKDPKFAMGWLQVANTSQSAKDFFAALKKAVALSGKVSEGERLIILGTEAGVNSEPEKQRRLFTELVEKYPSDPRAYLLLGTNEFGRQDWDGAVRALSKATELNPNYSAPYNQLGYAYRFQGKYPEAERTFRKYTELIPNDPNPYDSYAEFLMKVGRFDESIAKYRQALTVDPHFVASYIGIAHDQMFLGQGDEARKTLRQFLSTARTDGERRQALFWTSMSFANEGRWAEAIRAVEEEKKIADASGDLSAAAGDLQLIGNLSLAAGKPQEAMARFEEGQRLLERANVPAEVKEAGKRAHLFNSARVALGRGDLEGARGLSTRYATAVEAKKVPFERWQAHELSGMVALQAHDWDGALRELGQSTTQNPRVLYLTGLAYQGKGEAAQAQKAFTAAADFNALHPLLPFVRSDARRQLGRS